MPKQYPGLAAVTEQGMWHMASNSFPLAIMLPRLGERSGKPAPSAQRGGYEVDQPLTQGVM